MRVGISALYRAHGGSLTRLTEFLQDAARLGMFDVHRFVVFTIPETARTLSERLGPEVTSAVSIVPIPLADAGLLGRLRAEQSTLLRRLDEHRIDVLYCTANVVPFGCPVPTAVLFQNAAPFCESITRRTVGTVEWLKLRLLRRLILSSARRATAVICISEYFRGVLERETGRSNDRVRVVYPPRKAIVGDAGLGGELLSRLGLSGPFLVCVSHLYPYKNLLELIRGFVRAVHAAGRSEVRLVIAGASYVPSYRRAIDELLNGLGADASTVVLAGELTSDETHQLLCMGEAFVFTSTCENCPQALIEALEVGMPAAVSDIGVMPEVAGDASLYFDPYDVSDIAERLTELLSSPELRRELGERARARATRFPERLAVTREIMSILEGCAGVGAARGRSAEEWKHEE